MSSLSNGLPQEDLPKPWIETPLIRSKALSKLAGCDIYLKLENLQPSGSFKSRNVGNFILQHILSTPPSKRHALHFYTSSGGNAGLGAVIASNTLGYPCSVIVPLSTKPMMIEKLKEAGAVEVVQVGATWRDADTHLREEVLGNQQEGEKGIYVPPFDHETVWEASAMIIEEIERQLVPLQPAELTKEDGAGITGKGDRLSPDIVVCATGGGGLFSGLNLGIERSPISKDNTIMISSETIGAESLYDSVQSGHHTTLPGITSIATSLGAVQVCKKAFEYAINDDKVTCLKVTDKQAVSALIQFGDMERILVEPACGAALAIVYEKEKFEEAIKKSLGKGKKREELKVVVVVCGGSNVSLGMINEWKGMFDL